MHAAVTAEEVFVEQPTALMYAFKVQPLSFPLVRIPTKRIESEEATLAFLQ